MASELLKHEKASFALLRRQLQVQLTEEWRII
jgi:hypothetical protein